MQNPAVQNKATIVVPTSCQTSKHERQVIIFQLWSELITQKCNRLRSRYLRTATKRKPNRWSIWRSLILVMLWGLCEILHLLTKKRERGHVAGSPTTGRWLPTKTRRGSEIRLTTTVQHHISAEPSSSHLPLHLLTRQTKPNQTKQAHSKSNRSNLSTPIQVQQKNPTQKCTDSFLLPAKG
jgi:hypothetical protein